MAERIAGRSLLRPLPPIPVMPRRPADDAPRCERCEKILGAERKTGLCRQCLTEVTTGAFDERVRVALSSGQKAPEIARRLEATESRVRRSIARINRAGTHRQKPLRR